MMTTVARGIRNRQSDLEVSYAKRIELDSFNLFQRIGIDWSRFFSN